LAKLDALDELIRREVEDSPRTTLTPAAESTQEALPSYEQTR
jgi:hypothetical protein